MIKLKDILKEAKKRDYKAEYKKYGSSKKAKKYRAELNAYNRKKGTYGNGDGKDASHKGGKIVGFEAESKNRGRAEKSRLKKEGKLNEFNKAHFLNLIKKEIDSLKGQIAYAKDALRQKDIEDWEKKEFTAVLKDKIKELKEMIARQKRVSKWKVSEGKLTEGKNTKFISNLKNDIGKLDKLVKSKKPTDSFLKKDMMNLTKAANKIFDRIGTFKYFTEGKLTESRIAKTILQQLGGNKFIAMTGAKNLGASN